MSLPRREPATTRSPALGLVVGDHVDVDLAGLLHDRRADALVEDARPPRPSGGADHQLGGVHLAGEIQQRGGHVVADHGVQGGAEADGQLAHLAHLRRGHAGQAVAADDVDHHQLGAGLRRDPRCPAHQGFRLRPAGDGDDDALARLPGVGDLVLCAVLRQRGVDLVGQPEQRQFAQRGEVAAAEVVGQRGVDALGRVDVAVGEPAPQRLRRDVDQLDLVGRAHDLVGHLLLLLDAGDLGDDVVEALQVLDVDRGDDGDARRRAAPRRPASAWGSCCPGCWCGRVRRPAPPAGGAPARRRRRVRRSCCRGSRCSLRRDDLDAVEQLGGLLAAVGLHHGGHHVGAAFQPAVRLAEHRERLADAGSRAEVDAQLPALRASPVGRRLTRPASHVHHPPRQASALGWILLVQFAG